MNDTQVLSLDDIRKFIETYAKKVANLKDQKGQGLGILRMRSEIEKGLTFYRSKGAYLEPEETRLSNFDALLQKQIRLIVKITGKKAFIQERTSSNLSQDQWWWWLDIKYQHKQIKAVKKNIFIFTVFLGSLFFIYFFFLRLPPNERLYLDLNTSMERKIDQTWIESDQVKLSSLIDTILQESEKAISLFPERPTPYIIKGAVLERVKRDSEAQMIFDRARVLYENPEDFLLDQAIWFFRLNMMDRATHTLTTILNQNPNSIGAMNLLGTIYEAENNVIEALKAYNRVLELAEVQNQLTLIPVMKIKIAMLQLKLPMNFQ